MGFFDFGREIKEKADRSRQAREYLSMAKDYIRQGDEIYEKAYNKVSSYASETEYELRKHSDYKKNIAKELGSNVGNTLKSFSNFNIDSKVFSAPAIQNIQSSSMDLGSSFKSAVSSCMPNTDMHSQFGSILDMFISDDDYYEAKHQKDEAKRYKEHMKMERDKLNNYKEQMSEIRSFISAEKNELDSLMGKVRKMTSELQAGMQKSNFSQEEADYLKGMHKITECIVTLLSTQFINDSLSITQKYQQVFSGVKTINQNLPYAPSINDQTTLDAIKRILDGTIVY